MLNGIFIQEGIQETQIKELLRYTQEDSSIQENTNDLNRFATRAHFDRWFSKDKKVFVLTNPRKTLLGILWVTKKRLPKELNIKNYDDFSTTFGIRLYKNVRGKKLSYPFIKEVFKRFSLNKVWLIVLTINHIAIALYEKVGFKIIYSNDKIHVMTYEKRKK